MRPTSSRRVPRVVADPAAVVRDARQAQRCVAWAQADGLERHEGPGLLYRPTTRALSAFQSHPLLPPPQGQTYDFLRDAADPESLGALHVRELCGLYEAATDGLLMGAFSPEVPWRLRPHALALLEPYRRLVCDFGSGRHPLFLSAMEMAQEEVRLWTEQSWPPAAREAWQSRQRVLFCALGQSDVCRPTADEPECASKEMVACALGTACAVGVLYGMDVTHPEANAMGHYLSLACVLLLLSASVAVGARYFQVKSSVRAPRNVDPLYKM